MRTRTNMHLSQSPTNGEPQGRWPPPSHREGKPSTENSLALCLKVLLGDPSPLPSELLLFRSSIQAQTGIKIMGFGALRLGLQVAKDSSFRNITKVRFHMSLCMNQEISSNTQTHTLNVQWGHALSKFNFMHLKYLVSFHPSLTRSPVLCYPTADSLLLFRIPRRNA